MIFNKIFDEFFHLGIKCVKNEILAQIYIHFKVKYFTSSSFKNNRMLIVINIELSAYFIANTISHLC